VADILDSIAALLWPVVVAALIFRLLPVISRYISQSDSIDLEVGGNKISIQRASDQLRNQINDLQDKVNQLESGTAIAAPELPAVTTPPATRKAVLWVDDRPDANVYERARLRDEGYQIVQATSTTAALNAVQSQGPFEVIVSDMARIEAGGRLNPTAGMDLLRQIRGTDQQTPVVFYSSARSLEPVKPDLARFANVSYTTSPSELMRILRVSESG
jgi:CheY-like chemotaxis protein